jgi:CCR4-NOT transcription complex subunit 1
LNLKFEVEVLCKALEVKLDDLQATELLRHRQGHFTEHDFRPTAPGGNGAGSGSSGGGGRAALLGSVGGDGSLELSGGLGASGGGGAPVESEVGRAVSINAALLQAQPALRQCVPLAIERAVQEIVQPVVERSVTIAAITTRELVSKDFATEPNPVRMRRAAHLMVQNLAGSLSAVTCKDPLRVAIGNHLRVLLTAAGE